MRLGILLLGLTLWLPANAQDTIWFEGFNYIDGTTDPGNGKWSINTDSCVFDNDGGPNDDHFEVRDSVFSGSDLDGFAIWTSESIDISGETDGVKIKVDLWQYVIPPESMETNQDTLYTYYSLDGGPEVLLENGQLEGQFGSSPGFTCGSALIGNSLQIIIKARN
ncbi:MAG TPA: hypothetical protein ENI20_03640, partial [Bacteroides sp.]|nr:hypothetical protein [Bacteroides sp.]